MRRGQAPFAAFKGERRTQGQGSFETFSIVLIETCGQTMRPGAPSGRGKKSSITTWTYCSRSFGAPSADSRSGAHATVHHFSSVEVPLRRPVSTERLLNALKSLPRQVLRVKGIARLAGSGEAVYFERTDLPGAISLHPLPAAGSLDCVAVLIGVGLDAPALARALEEM